MADSEGMLARADDLAEVLRRRPLPLVICHADLHPGNVLVGRDGSLAIVDWDAPLLAPKARDLMGIGGGLGLRGEIPATEALFYQGYGAATVDRTALAYTGTSASSPTWLSSAGPSSRASVTGSATFGCWKLNSAQAARWTSPIRRAPPSEPNEPRRICVAAQVKAACEAHLC